jgi:hypothetical protein
VADAARLEPERSHVARPCHEVHDVERGGREAGLGVERVQPRGEPVRCHDGNAASRVELPAKVVTERDEVDEVVRVEVADRDEVDRARLQRGSKLGKAALADVQQERSPTVTNEVRRARGPGPIRVGRTGAQDEEVQPRSPRGG